MARVADVWKLALFLLLTEIVTGDLIHHCEFFSGTLCPGWRQGVDGVEDDVQWSVNRGRTMSANTGPNGDHSESGDGFYVYLESTAVPNKAAARLFAPVYNHNGTVQLLFWYHMKGIFVGNLNVYTNGTLDGAERLLWSRNDNQGADWLMASITVDTNASFRFIFEATVGSTTADIALDDITITLIGASDVTTAETPLSSVSTPSTVTGSTSLQTPLKTMGTTKKTIKPYPSTVAPTNFQSSAFTRKPIASKENIVTIYRYVTVEGISGEEVIFISVGIAVSFCFWTAIFLLVVCYVRKRTRMQTKLPGVELSDMRNGYEDPSQRAYEQEMSEQRGGYLQNESTYDLTVVSSQDPGDAADDRPIIGRTYEILILP